LHIFSPEFKYPVIWSTPGKEYICVEPLMAKQNSMNTGEDLYRLKPGEVFRAFLNIRAEEP